MTTQRALVKRPVPARSHLDKSIQRMFAAILAMALLALLGGGLYFVLGRGVWNVGECIYMSVITISTVGFGELNDMARVPGARAVTVFLIVSGIGVIAYFQANLTALLVEGTLGQVLRRNRMRRRIVNLQQHVVVAGAGSTGRHVIEELIATEQPFVVIERNREHADHLSHELLRGEMLVVYGDATMDHALLEAGVDRAKGVVAALTLDKDNVFVTLSARSLNATARIVSKVVEEESVPKMLKAGANRVVSPAMIGGRRLASELVRPDVTEFLDGMLRDKHKNMRLEEVVVRDGSALAGVTLKDSSIREETRALVIALRPRDGEFAYNPEPSVVLSLGCTLIALGEADSIRKLKAMAGDAQQPLSD